MGISLGSRSHGRRQEVNIRMTDFKAGTISLLDQTRIPLNGAFQSTNLYQMEDGLWTVRPGTSLYGQPIPGLLSTGTIDGAAEYLRSDGTTELIAVANGVVQKSQNGGAWSTISGATFTAGQKCFFLQVKLRLYITNGIDVLAYYDGTMMNMYSVISAPGIPTLTLGSGLSSGTYNQYYQIVAVNNVGQTQGSIEATITINKPRDQWINATGSAPTQYISLTWGAVSGALRYDIYTSDASNYEQNIASVNNTSFIDDGSAPLNPYVVVPLDNTTAAPKFKQMELSGNRIWATQDTNNKYRVYWGGTGNFEGYFSPFYGGGYIDLEQGGRNTPVSVVHYRNGSGSTLITVLCTDPEGTGTTWQITLGTQTTGTVTYIVPSADKIVGSIGSVAPYAVIKSRDAIIFPNAKGFYRLGNVPQLLNILSSDELSANVRPSVQNLNLSQLPFACGYYYLAKLYFSLPSSTLGNDQTWIYDTERGNWQISWTMGFSQFLEYTDTNKISYFLGIPTTGNQFVSISPNISGDKGQAFNTSYISGLYSVDQDDRRKFGKIRYAYLELANPKGTINFEVLGTQKKSGFSSIGTKSITDTTSQTGFSWEKFSTMRFSKSSGKAVSYSSATVKKRIRINKLINNIQFHVYSNDINAQYTILSLQAIGYIVPTRDPSSWIQ